MGTGSASETEGKRGSTWGQGDAAIRGGIVWQRGMEVVQADRARSGVRREKGVPGEGHQVRRVRGEGMTESGDLVNPVNKISKVPATVRDADEDASSGLRRSSRAKSSWTPFLKEDCCSRRRTLGEVSRPTGLQKFPTHGWYCPEECIGVDNKGCTNRATVFTTENWVHMTKGRGLDPTPQCLRTKKDIPGNNDDTVWGGYTVGLDTERSIQVLY
jgi:hypothetical protein